MLRNYSISFNAVIYFDGNTSGNNLQISAVDLAFCFGTCASMVLRKE